ncbi:hypothetical protein K1T71_013779 [Dendrolimus kikuchii]|uniref:Uncharacterized protein n=1 Tax=Dendrolimus kikuchii TaxID=765133 RepID=A0ACC1CFQ5_9NEOP|nr:hypothetical protein K1T71_013779 [Dendrolimus kikuchii]
MPLQVAVGAFLAGPLLTYAGRKYSIMGVGVLFFIGWSILATASNKYFYISGQVLCAISTGVLFAVFPVYIVETVRPDFRGALGLLPTAFKYCGATLSYITGVLWDWSKMACFATSLSVSFFLLMILTPESPRWYIAKNHPDKARKSLQWLRGQNYNIENEIQDLTRSQIEANKSTANAFTQMFYMENIPAVLIPIALMLFQQLSGSNVIIYYSQTISDKSSGIDLTLFGVILGITSIVATLISIVLIDRIGRKILLYISSWSMIISLILLAAVAYVHESSISVGLLSRACVILHVFGLSLGYESIPWLILGEILPLRIRDTAASLITGVNWIFTFYVSIMFPNILRSITLNGSMVFFVVIHLIELLFVIFCVTETCGKSLEEIELNLTQRVKNVNGNADVNPDTNADVNGDA